jgi:hypothetical protein
VAAFNSQLGRCGLSQARADSRASADEPCGPLGVQENSVSIHGPCKEVAMKVSEVMTRDPEII